jgi:tRNA threonylcarbamoyladenosine biosynthesis protein TsaE
MIKKVFTLDQIDDIAKDITRLVFSKDTNKATIVLLYGDLGAGKTHITKSVAKALGIKEKIISPTFVLMKKYEIKKNNKFKYLIHIDAYRIEDEKEIEQIGYKEMIQNKDNLIFIEWPEKIHNYLPKNKIEINLSHIDEKTRKITLK